MAEVKIIVGHKTGKSYQKTLESSDNLIGRRIGENIKGDLIGLSGYEFLVTGGSDHCGFPMRSGIKGNRRIPILAKSGIGIKKKKDKGTFIRKTVVGDTIGDKTIQVNLKITKEGSKKLDELFGNKEAPKEEAKTEEKPKEEKKEVKEEPKKETKEGGSSAKKD